jgi:ABC-2 type transport system ATP-binding protein
MSDSNAIVAVELSRWYGIVMGLNNVSFAVPRGLTGLVGPNGAGKSTLMQIITGQLQPSSGSLTVFGQPPWNNPGTLARIGYCPEHEAVPTDLKPLDWLKGLGLLAGFDSDASTTRAHQMLERVKLPVEAWNRRMGQYSKGMRQRVKLAQALLHEPDLLILDEPMNGLDPMGRQEMSQIMRDLASSGTSILVSSHILAELEPLCQEILIINWGRIIATGSQFEIRADVKDWPEELQVQCDQPEKLARHLFESGLLLGFDIQPEDGILTFRVKDGPAFYARSLDLLLESGVRIQEVRSRSRSLKEIYEKVTT